jgi:hypothetical protein
VDLAISISKTLLRRRYFWTVIYEVYFLLIYLSLIITLSSTAPPYCDNLLVVKVIKDSQQSYSLSHTKDAQETAAIFEHTINKAPKYLFL